MRCGRDALEARNKAQYIVKPLQITVRAKVDTYDGEPFAYVTCVQAVVAQPAVIGRKMALAASCRRLVWLAVGSTTTQHLDLDARRLWRRERTTSRRDILGHQT